MRCSCSPPPTSGRRPVLMASAKGRGRRVVLCQEQDRAVTNSVTSDDQQGRILEVLTRLEGKVDALVREQAELVRGQAALVRGQAAVTRGQAAVTRGQGAITELRVIQNLPAGLRGCKRARITTAAQLDKLLGPGTAVAVERELLGSTERCYLALRALLWAAARELDRVSKQASAQEAAGQATTEVQSLKEELLSAAAAECNPDPDVVWDFLQRTQEVLDAAGRLKETQDEDCRQQGLSQRLNAAFMLVRRIADRLAGGGSSSSGGSDGGSQLALLLLFLMATGRLRSQLELDAVRLRLRVPPLGGPPQLTLGAIKSDLAEINKAREQLTTSVAVLELACRFRPTPLASLQGMFTPYRRWRPPSLAAQAFMVGILDGEALEAGPDLLTDLQVPLVSMDLQTPAWREGAPTTGLPLAVYRFGDEGSCVAAPEGE